MIFESGQPIHPSPGVQDRFHCQLLKMRHEKIVGKHEMMKRRRIMKHIMQCSRLQIPLMAKSSLSAESIIDDSCALSCDETAADTFAKVAIITLGSVNLGNADGLMLRLI